MIKLQNCELEIAVKLHGAELCSIVKNGCEHLWNADAAIWARHSPVLFPLLCLGLVASYMDIGPWKHIRHLGQHVGHLGRVVLVHLATVGLDVELAAGAAGDRLSPQRGQLGLSSR